MTTLTNFNKTDLLDDHVAADVNKLIATSLRAEHANTETITATKELSDNDTPFQIITASGADRTVELAPEATTNHVTIVENGGASNRVIVKDDSGATTFVTLAVGEWALFLPLGTRWVFLKGRTVTDDWTEVTEAWAYASATTITVPTDAITRYQKGDRIRFKQGGGYKYVYATTVAATLLTTNGGSDFTVANSAITDIAYSRAVSPHGFPVEFNWSPAPSGLTIGNGTMTAKFKMIGMGVYFHWEFVFGSTSAISGTVNFTLPIAAAGYGTSVYPIGLTRFKDATGGNANSGITIAIAGLGQLMVLNSGGAYAVQDNLTSTIPFTWAVSDEIQVDGSYFA